MRYVQVPEKVLVKDPVSGAAMKHPDGKERTISFREFIFTATSIAAQKGAADTLLLVEIRESVSVREASDVWEVPDAWHKVLVDNTRRMVGWGASELFAAVPFIRAVQDAPTERPKAKGNDKTEEAAVS